MKKDDYANLYNDYVECKLTTNELCKKYGIMKSVIDMVVKEFANNELDGDLTGYYKALAKRRKIYKEKQEEERKKKEAEMELQRKDKNVREIKYTLNSFLDSDLNEQDFCSQYKMSIKYFEDSLYDIKDIDRKLYMSVKAKFYTDYVKEEKQKYEEKIQDEENEKLAESQTIMKKYMSFSGNISDFCNKNLISKKNFQDSLYQLKQNSPKMYSLVKDKLSDDIVNSSYILGKIITKVAFSIQHGISNSDSSKRDFTLLDYYKMTRIDLNNLAALSQKNGMTPEFKIIDKFIKKNAMNMKNIEPEKAFKNLSKDDEIISKEALTYMKNNALPDLAGIYDIVFKKIKLQENIKFQKESQEEQEENQSVQKVLNKNIKDDEDKGKEKDKGEDKGEDKEFPKMDDLLEEEFKLKIDDKQVINQAMNYVRYGYNNQEKVMQKFE